MTRRDIGPVPSAPFADVKRMYKPLWLSVEPAVVVFMVMTMAASALALLGFDAPSPDSGVSTLLWSVFVGSPLLPLCAAAASAINQWVQREHVEANVRDLAQSGFAASAGRVSGEADGERAIVIDHDNDRVAFVRTDGYAVYSLASVKISKRFSGSADLIARDAQNGNLAHRVRRKSIVKRLPTNTGGSAEPIIAGGALKIAESGIGGAGEAAGI